ncbi:MAG: YuzF family protein [Paenisporosarcina sp.]
MNGEAQQSVEYTSAYDPYVYQTLMSIIGQKIVVQLTNNSLVIGVLSNVLPDHIVVEKNKTPFFIRSQQIIWVSPGN